MAHPLCQTLFQLRISRVAHHPQIHLLDHVDALGQRHEDVGRDPLAIFGNHAQKQLENEIRRRGRPRSGSPSSPTSLAAEGMVSMGMMGWARNTKRSLRMASLKPFLPARLQFACRAAESSSLTDKCGFGCGPSSWRVHTQCARVPGRTRPRGVMRVRMTTPMDPVTGPAARRSARPALRSARCETHQR